MDLKIVRQVLTWGTGDLLFINDLFPKDWNAFFIGRDMQYLKAPSDALKISIFHSLANLDLVYTPRFDADRYPDRARLSSWDPMAQDIVGRNDPLLVQLPRGGLTRGEFAGRLYRRLGGYELAAYGYRGYWKSPSGVDANSGRYSFPVLSVYGASIRRVLWGGVANAEGGYFDSRTDREGDNPLVRNSEVRGLVGFERDLGGGLSLGSQYYVEYLRNYQAHRNSLGGLSTLGERARHVLTARVRYLAMNQNLQLSFFGFLSPNEKDSFVMPAASYAIDDHWNVSLGANIARGAEYTMFGQLHANSNVHASLRSSW